MIFWGSKSLSRLWGRDLPVPNTFSMASSLGPVQPNMSPDRVTTEFDRRDLSSIGNPDVPISLRAGMEYALVMPSAKTQTKAQLASSKSATVAESHNKLSQDL